MKKKKKADEDRELTQEELLEEAKLTEKLNLASLKRYEEMELEAKKKAVKLTEKRVKGPYVRYLSTTMPSIKAVKDKDDAIESKSGRKYAKEGQQERTFLTFSDFDSLRSTFPVKKPRQPQQKICPITRLPAKYFDPVTRLPYANLQAFRVLRDHYYQQLEKMGDKSDPEVAAWLEWRAKNKPAKPAHLTQVTRTPPAFTNNQTSKLAQVALPMHPNPPTSSTTTSSVAQSSPHLAAAIRKINPISQQSVVLPVRTTPLASSASTTPTNSTTPFSVTQVLQGQSPVAVVTSTTPALPTQPAAVVTGNVHTVKIAGQTAQVSNKLANILVYVTN